MCHIAQGDVTLNMVSSVTSWQGAEGVESGSNEEEESGLVETTMALSAR